MTNSAKISRDILLEALKVYKPVNILLLFSGGHDSLCSTYFTASFLKKRKIAFSIYHGNTGIGIYETRMFVKSVCEQFSWPLYEGCPEPGQTYEDLIRIHGFPGPASHKYMYRMLKERALRKYVTHCCKSSIHARENVLLVTGIRRSESKIRMGYKEYFKKEGSRVWCSPLFFWNDEDIGHYMQLEDLPRNSVKDTICISGECLCGAFAGAEEWIEIKTNYPAAAKEIERLQQIAISSGHPWGWASNPNQYASTKKAIDLPMCIGCVARHETSSSKNA